MKRNIHENARPREFEWKMRGTAGESRNEIISLHRAAFRRERFRP